MYKFFIGIDVSKSKFDVSYHDGCKSVYLGEIKNNISGFKKLVVILNQVTHHPCLSWFVCFENTGVYSKPLLEWLMSQQISCREENALKIARSMGLRRGKNDKVDSKDICQYVFEKRDCIEVTSLAKPLIVNLKKLLSRRDLLVRKKQSLTNSLKDQKKTMDIKFYTLFSSQNKRLIKYFNCAICEIDQLIEQVITADEQTNKNYEVLLSIKGIGPVIAAYLIAFTHNFTLFENARKFASYCGIAPFLMGQSGIRKGTMRVSHMANKKIKSLLSNGVAAAIRFDPQLRQYYLRKLADGKKKGVVLNNLKNKLVHRAFAVVTRQTPFVQTVNYL